MKEEVLLYLENLIKHDLDDIENHKIWIERTTGQNQKEWKESLKTVEEFLIHHKAIKEDIELIFDGKPTIYG